MAGTLDGKVAIITGAAQGIGRRYAETLAREGASVVLADLKEDKAHEAAVAIEQAGGRAIAIGVDVANEESTLQMCKGAAKHFGGIDILVNNAGIYEGYVSHTLDQVPLDDWNRFLNVNVTSILLCTRAVVPYMKERGGGRVVNQSSDGAELGGNQYALTKLLVQGFTTGFAPELGPHNITVNAISPGPINTEATLAKYPEEAIKAMVESSFLIKRIGTPNDLAEFLAFIVSDRAGWITGQIFHVNGGFWTRPG
jgi:NAD(P)-dependent dehydrogenase (short-subunit alcohol dehydrogenase family)